MQDNITRIDKEKLHELISKIENNKEDKTENTLIFLSEKNNHFIISKVVASKIISELELKNKQLLPIFKNVCFNFQYT